MQIGRTSCSNFLAKTFRVLLTAAAYVLMQEMRLHLSTTRHARVQVSTLREHFQSSEPKSSPGASRRAALASSVSVPR
jgi:hypothetical protein